MITVDEDATHQNEVLTRIFCFLRKDVDTCFDGLVHHPCGLQQWFGGIYDPIFLLEENLFNVVLLIVELGDEIGFDFVVEQFSQCRFCCATACRRLMLSHAIDFADSSIACYSDMGAK